MAIKIILGVLFALFLLTTALTAFCFRKIFYFPKRKPLQDDEYPLVPGEVYKPYQERMIAWIKEMRALPKEQVRHAYIPDVYGKERRKAAPGKEGKMGVEGMTPQVLLDALERAGATFADDAVQSERTPVTKADFFELGLTGGKDSTARRAALLKKLALPEHMTTNALLEAVNILCGREELMKLMEE